MESLNVTLVQSNLIWEDREKNLLNFEEKINAINNPTDLIILPEMFNTGFTMNNKKSAEDMNGITMNWLSKIAAFKNCSITGSLIIKEGDFYFNRLIWMNRDGSFYKYDKHHLFRYGKENLNFNQGNESLTVELNGWKIKPLICYDLRFPVWSRNKVNLQSTKHEARSTEFDYDFLIYIANWPSPRKYAWKSLLIARAIENMSYAIGVNRIGTDGKGLEYKGKSLAIDFNGEILTELKNDAEEIQTIALSYEKLKSFRDTFGFYLDWDKFSIKL